MLFKTPLARFASRPAAAADRPLSRSARGLAVARRLADAAAAASLAVVLTAGTASAQGSGQQKDPELKPRPVELKTADGLKLRAIYFPSDEGKKAIPVMFVHEWGGQMSRPYAKLAFALRDAGCAVLIPEYRGHGQSREFTNPRGQTVTLDPSKMRKMDIAAIVKRDLESAKKFLKQENNEGKLNLNALVIIGVEEGCILGAHWTVTDWRFPSLGRKKQGQDVKGLVMISPEKTLMGVSLAPAVRDPNILRLPIMIVAGSESSEAGEARRIADQIETRKARFGRGRAAGFEFQILDTNLSGPRLLAGSDAVMASIVDFITSQVPTTDETNPWIERE